MTDFNVAINTSACILHFLNMRYPVLNTDFRIMFFKDISIYSIAIASELLTVFQTIYPQRVMVREEKILISSFERLRNETEDLFRNRKLNVDLPDCRLMM